MYLANQYYYVKYMGIEGDYYKFGIGIDSEEILFGYYVLVGSIKAPNGLLERVIHTQPNYTDCEYTDDHKALFEKIGALLSDTLKSMNFEKFNQKFYVN